MPYDTYLGALYFTGGNVTLNNVNISDTNCASSLPCNGVIYANLGPTSSYQILNSSKYLIVFIYVEFMQNIFDYGSSLYVQNSGTPTNMYDM